MEYMFGLTKTHPTIRCPNKAILDFVCLFLRISRKDKINMHIHLVCSPYHVSFRTMHISGVSVCLGEHLLPRMMNRLHHYKNWRRTSRIFPSMSLSISCRCVMWKRQYDKFLRIVLCSYGTKQDYGNLMKFLPRKSGQGTLSKIQK